MLVEGVRSHGRRKHHGKLRFCIHGWNRSLFRAWVPKATSHTLLRLNPAEHLISPISPQISSSLFEPLPATSSRTLNTGPKNSPGYLRLPFVASNLTTRWVLVDGFGLFTEIPTPRATDTSMNHQECQNEFVSSTHHSEQRSFSDQSCVRQELVLSPGTVWSLSTGRAKKCLCTKTIISTLSSTVPIGLMLTQGHLVPPYEKTKPLHARHSSLDFRKADKEKDFMRQNVFEVQLVTSCPIASAPARGLSAKSHLNTKQRPVIFMDKDYQAASAKCSEFFWVASHLCKDLLQKTFLAGHLDLS